MRRWVSLLLVGLFAACAPDAVQRLQRLPEEDAARRPNVGDATGAATPSDGSALSSADSDAADPAVVRFDAATDVVASSGAPDARPAPDLRPADVTVLPPPDLPRPEASGVLPGVAPLCPSAIAADDLVSDFEQDANVLARGGRVVRAWELVHDGTSTATLARGAAAGACGGQTSLRFNGSGFTTWGAAALAFFHDKLAYDASAYRGMRVRLRASAPVLTRLKVTDLNNWAGGPVCKVCGNSFGRDAQIDTTWREYVLWFDDLSQTIYGDRFPSFDRRALIAFEVIGRTGDTFDVFVDDLAFFR